MYLAIRPLCNFAGMLAASILCRRSSSPFAVAVRIVNGDPANLRVPVVINNEAAIILGASDPNITPLAESYALVNISCTVIVYLLCIMSTDARPCRQCPAQDLM